MQFEQQILQTEKQKTPQKNQHEIRTVLNWIK